VVQGAYEQTGRCADSGTRLELQADHVKGREEFEDALDADFIENMTLRCRRCNVIRRPSHEYGGLTLFCLSGCFNNALLVVSGRAAPALSEELARVSASLCDRGGVPALLGRLSLARGVQMPAIAGSAWPVTIKCP
jgi:hypothetical protein